MLTEQETQPRERKHTVVLLTNEQTLRSQQLWLPYSKHEKDFNRFVRMVHSKLGRAAFQAAFKERLLVTTLREELDREEEKRENNAWIPVPPKRPEQRRTIVHSVPLLQRRARPRDPVTHEPEIVVGELVQYPLISEYFIARKASPRCYK